MAPRGPSTESEERPSREGEYPWEQHELALHHLGRLELKEARELLEAMLPRFRSLPPDRVPAAGLLAYELIGRIRSTLGMGGPINGESRPVRWNEARTFAAASSGLALAALFQAALEDALRPYRGTSMNPLVAGARAYIEQNYSRKLSLRDVAAFLNVSRNYLSSLFRKECGCTITEYIHQTRLKRAEALLLAGGRTVSEIAYQVGYQNYRDFYRNFVKYEHSSPTRFRRARSERRRPFPPAQA
jgi:AraC-like DNA-binding protein